MTTIHRTLLATLTIGTIVSLLSLQSHRTDAAMRECLEVASLETCIKTIN